MRNRDLMTMQEMADELRYCLPRLILDEDARLCEVRGGGEGGMHYPLSNGEIIERIAAARKLLRPLCDIILAQQVATRKKRGDDSC